jgi:hypothetical protein
MKQTYIGYLIELLRTARYRGAAEEIQIAMGKYKLPNNIKEATRKIKKQWL